MHTRPSLLAKNTAHKLPVARNVCDRLDEQLYAIAYILLQRQMRKHWA